MSIVYYLFHPFPKSSLKTKSVNNSRQNGASLKKCFLLILLAQSIIVSGNVARSVVSSCPVNLLNYLANVPEVIGLQYATLIVDPALFPHTQKNKKQKHTH